MKTSMSSISISPAASRSSRYGVSQWTTGPAPTPAKDLIPFCGGSFPLSAVTSARLPQVTFAPGSSKDRGKTSCPQQLAQPRTTRDHRQGNGWLRGLSGGLKANQPQAEPRLLNDQCVPSTMLCCVATRWRSFRRLLIQYFRRCRSSPQVWGVVTRIGHRTSLCSGRRQFPE